MALTWNYDGDMTGVPCHGTTGAMLSNITGAGREENSKLLISIVLIAGMV